VPLNFARAKPNSAIAICLASAVLGAFAIHRGWLRSPSNVAFDVGCCWWLAGNWLSGGFTPEGWRRLHKPIGAIYQDAKEGKLPRAPPLARIMEGGGTLLFLAGVVGWFY